MQLTNYFYIRTQLFIDVLKFGLISFLLVLSIVSITSSAQGQEETVFNCQSDDPEIAKIADSLEKGREETRKNYQLYGDSALSALEDLPEQFQKTIKKSFETEILMEKIKTNENIEYKNCSHLLAVQIELTNVLKTGDESWNEYWQNQKVDLSKKDIKQIKEYIQKYIDAEKKQVTKP